MFSVEFMERMGLEVTHTVKALNLLDVSGRLLERVQSEATVEMFLGGL